MEIILSMGFGQNLFVAGVNDITYPYMTSSDGVNWTKRRLKFRDETFTTSFGPTGVAYGNGMFMGMAGGEVDTSTDGVNWYSVAQLFDSAPFPTTASTVAYTGSLFVAGSEDGLVCTSTDGKAWSIKARTGSALDNMQLAYGNGIIVAAGSRHILTSKDGGITFRLVNNPTHGTYTAFFTSVAYGDGVFVAVDVNGVIYSSTDGVTWIWRGNYANGDAFNGVAFGLHTFAAIGEVPTAAVDGNTAWLYTSTMPSWHQAQLTDFNEVYPSTKIAVDTNLRYAYYVSRRTGLTVLWWGGTSWRTGPLPSTGTGDPVVDSTTHLSGM